MELYLFRHEEYLRAYNCSDINFTSSTIQQKSHQFVPESIVSILLCAIYYASFWCSYWKVIYIPSSTYCCCRFCTFPACSQCGNICAPTIITWSYFTLASWIWAFCGSLASFMPGSVWPAPCSATIQNWFISPGIWLQVGSAIRPIIPQLFSRYLAWRKCRRLGW
jgi:hypothetical protein